MSKENENFNEAEKSALNIAYVSGSLLHSEELKRIREKFLNSTNPLRFIDYATDEKWYMNERNHKLNCH